ncbi:MAG TPA: CBS domain-containing protein [Actinomycetota bacterium]|nr:CBS domain-containing protein [Actinomycetota bacterium]
MRVREVMSSPVVTVQPDMPLKEVAKVLVTHAISAVPVVDDGVLVGLLSEADLVPLELAPDPRAHLALLPETSEIALRTASEAMTREVVALAEEADVADAGRLMLERRIKSIPVVRGRRVVGIVARRDLLEVLARSDEEITRDLEALLAAELDAPCPYRVTVRDGVVDLTGPSDPVDRQLATLLAREVSGVLEVRPDKER